MKKILASGILAAVAVGTALSQVEPVRIGFDAVSIRPSAADARGGGFNLSPGRLTAKNQNLKDLVAFAYHLHSYQLSGGSGWTDIERYEIAATFPASTTDEHRARMLQTMLADRFALEIREERRDVSGYGLVTGKNGPRLRVADGGEHGMMLGRSQATGQRTLTANSAKLADLASILADLLGRPVEDKSGLPGIFDFTMEWTPDSVGEGPLRPGAEKQQPTVEGQTGPSIFTALQESLGLKLETTKVQVKTILIVHAEKPSAN